MSSTKKKKQDRPTTRTKRPSRDKFPAFDELVVGGAVPRVKVKVFPSRGKGKNRPAEHLVVELQCEV